MKRVILAICILSSLVFAATATARPQHDRKFEFCKVQNGVESRTLVFADDVEHFLSSYPLSYRGDCDGRTNPAPVFVPQVNRDGACASTPVFRQDGTYGTFIDLDQFTYNSGVYLGVKFTFALFVKGIGETCVLPAGYHYAGYQVDEGGTPNLAAPQFNQHPFYVQN